MNTNPWTQRLNLVRLLLVANVIGMGWMAYKVAEPFWKHSQYVPQSTPGETESTLKLPDYDLKTWAEWPVLEEGRIKPLQTVAIETTRSITGRATFQGQKAMPLFLSWIFYDPKNFGQGIDWDRYPFILCEDFDLRAEIFGVKMDDPDPAIQAKVHGKHISPLDLYNSKAFQRLMVEISKVREKDRDNFQQQLNSLQRKASSVQQRLQAYQELTGPIEIRDPAYGSVIKEKRYLKLDPVHYVALDTVKDSSWFSIGELKYILGTMRAPMLSETENANLVWQEFMQERVSLQPRLYLKEDARNALTALQAAIKNGQTDSIISQLQIELTQRAEKLQPMMIDQAVKQEMSRLNVDKMTEAEIQELSGRVGQKMTLAELKQKITAGMTEQVKKQQTTRNEKILRDLKERVAAASLSKPYVPENQRYNQMYMDYLEARFPEMYQAAIKSQPFPYDKAKAVVIAYDAVGAAYRSNDAGQFTAETTKFFDTVTKISQETTGLYPGDTTISLELLLNRVEPFKWAWMSMLLAAILFALSLRLENKFLYFAAYVPMLISLGFQLFAYYGRISISGRPPVSNMFETVVFVASMGAVFALMLECYYKNTIIILAGSIVATLGMILADQLPYSRGFDAKIDPLVPVLRSNYWLIIHVMTIVASYAAGALAWAIGNISLVLYWFNSDRRDLLKSLANLCYSAIKVAVLLLGVGTLLGGIWAAESWGRFWGWDPKETWALIALVVYLLPLHARYIGLVKDFGMAIASVVCFSAIVMSWYGVNFILGAGLHSYGMGDGGPWTIFLIGSINLLWVLIVCHRRATLEMTGSVQAV